MRYPESEGEELLAVGETVADALRRLRLSRGLSLGEASRRTGLSKSSMRDWEGGRHVPAGASLTRLLDLLGPEPGERARLLALADPGYARLELAHTPLGAPIDVGQVLRALRLRKGATQAEAARFVGVGQSAFAKWESGDSAPSPEALGRAMAALGASETEREAAPRFAGGDPCRSESLEELEARIVQAGEAIPRVHLEFMFLCLEAEVWWRTTREPAAQRLLCRIMAARAHNALFCGGPAEVRTLAARATRLAQALGTFTEASSAVYAACWHRQRSGGDTPGAIRTLRRWRERVSPPRYVDWLWTSEALAMVRAGAEDEGMAVLRSVERRAIEEGDALKTAYVRTDIIDAYLLSERPHRAADVLHAMGSGAKALSRIQVAVALGEEPNATDVAQYRRESDPGNHVDRPVWAQLERDLSRLRRGAVA